MLIGLIISLCLNAAAVAVLACQSYLLRQVVKIARQQPVAVLRDASPEAQAAMGIASDVTGMTAEEKAEYDRMEREEIAEREQHLHELTGMSSDELRKMMGLP